MSDNVEVLEFKTDKQVTELEYIYVTIPAEYICVYHRILVMLADYGIEMLEDCKATCKDRNSGVIECFNMFNAAVAARTLGKGEFDNKYTKLASTLIQYIKAKINQIYKGEDNSTSFVFPVDETGHLKAFVSCGERPKFYIDKTYGELLKHKFDNGFDEHFRLGEEDFEQDEDSSETIISGNTNLELDDILEVTIAAHYEQANNRIVPCADIKARYDGKDLNLNNTTYQYYFDGEPVIRFNDVTSVSQGKHEFKVVVIYKDQTAIAKTIV